MLQRDTDVNTTPHSYYVANDTVYHTIMYDSNVCKDQRHAVSETTPLMRYFAVARATIELNTTHVHTQSSYFVDRSVGKYNLSLKVEHVSSSTNL